MGKVKTLKKLNLAHSKPVLIPYGKGKAELCKEFAAEAAKVYQFPMGKVKSFQNEEWSLAHLYQFPMGKVKEKNYHSFNLPCQVSIPYGKG